MATMFDNLLDVVGGPIPGTPYALMKTAKVGSGQTASNFVAGRVVSLNSSGDFIIGAEAPAGGGASLPMPMFLVNSYNDFDVAGDSGNLVGAARSLGDPDVYSSAPRLSAIVATGGYEIETTEYTSATNLVPNRPLTATASQTGKVTAATALSGTPGTIVGIASAAVAASHRSSTNLVARLWTTALFIHPAA